MAQSIRMIGRAVTKRHPVIGTVFVEKLAANDKVVIEPRESLPCGTPFRRSTAEVSNVECRTGPFFLASDILGLSPTKYIDTLPLQ
jgi:hypothetical protein